MDKIFAVCVRRAGSAFLLIAFICVAMVIAIVAASPADQPPTMQGIDVGTVLLCVAAISFCIAVALACVYGHIEEPSE